jgi:hypothetical protein
MGEGDLIPITGADGLTAWVHEPPEQCPNRHPWKAASGAYRQSWFGCWCDGAQDTDDPRPGHLEFACKTCDETVLVPACTNPSLKIGWAASHGG